MEVQEARRATSGHAAPAAIAAAHEATRLRRDVLRGALRGEVRADPLRIALRDRTSGIVDGIAPAARFVLGTIAARTHHGHDLKPRAAAILVVGNAFEIRAAQRAEHGVVGGGLAAIVL